MATEMPININDMVKETADVVGVGGNYSLNGAVAGFFSFVGSGFATKKVIYRATDGIDIEIAEATVNSGSPDTITRPATDGDIIRSTNNDSRVNWASGTTVEIINFVNASRMKSLIDALELLDAKGKILTHSGSAVMAKAIGATNGHVATVNSAHAHGWDWEAQAPGGSEHIETIDASAASSVEFTTGINANHRKYIVHGTHLTGSADPMSPQLDLSDDAGSTWKSDANYDFDESPVGTPSTNNTFLPLGSTGTAAGENMSIEFWIFAPAVAGYKHGWFRTVQTTHAGALDANFETAWRFDLNSGFVCNGIRIRPSSGTMTGKFTLIGYSI